MGTCVGSDGVSFVSFRPPGAPRSRVSFWRCRTTSLFWGIGPRIFVPVGSVCHLQRCLSRWRPRGIAVRGVGSKLRQVCLVRAPALGHRKVYNRWSGIATLCRDRSCLVPSKLDAIFGRQGYGLLLSETRSESSQVRAVPKTADTSSTAAVGRALTPKQRNRAQK